MPIEKFTHFPTQENKISLPYGVIDIVNRLPLHQFLIEEVKPSTGKVYLHITLAHDFQILIGGGPLAERHVRKLFTDGRIEGVDIWPMKWPMQEGCGFIVTNATYVSWQDFQSGKRYEGFVRLLQRSGGTPFKSYTIQTLLPESEVGNSLHKASLSSNVEIEYHNWRKF